MSKKLSESYDWIVVGRSPGAALSGALAAKLGLTVLFLPEIEYSEEHTPQTTHETHHHDSQMGLLPVQGAEPLLLRCLKHIGFQDSFIETKTRHLTPELQLLSPDFRMQIKPGSVEKLARSIEWYLGETGLKKLGITWILEKLGPAFIQQFSGIPERLTLQPKSKPKANPENRSGHVDWKVLAKSHKQPAFRFWTNSSKRLGSFELAPDFERLHSLVYAWVSPLTLCNPDELSLQEILTLVSLFSSAQTYQGGPNALANDIMSHAEKLGAVVATEYPWKKTVTRLNEYIGVQAKGISGLISSRGLVSTVPMQTETKSSHAFLWMGCEKPKHLVPVSANHWMWKEVGAPFLCLKRNENSVNLIAPVQSSMLSDINSLKVLRRRMLEKASELYQSPVEAHSEAVMSPLYLEKGKHARSRIPGVFLLERTTYPQYGSLGEIVGALESVAWIAHRSGFPGPLGHI